MSNTFQLGTCTVPEGSLGPWTIKTIKYKPDRLFDFMENFRLTRDGYGFCIIPAGTYKQLVHEKHGVVMSNTRMEIITNMDAYLTATGRVLINGLGMGMLLEALLRKSDVTYIKVIEIDADLIKLVGPHFAKDKRVEIVQSDAYQYKPAKDERYDYIWHDIWNNLSSENFPKMAELTKKWRGRARLGQGVWLRKEVRAAERGYA